MKLLRVWFLDPPTRMNPNFTGAQAVPGVNDGRGTGLIEFAGMPSLVDALGLLKASPAWPDKDQSAMTAWLTAHESVWRSQLGRRTTASTQASLT